MGRLFQVGEVVWEEGGDGREMLVEGYDAAGRVLCSFWEGVSRKTGAFPESALTNVPPRAGPASPPEGR